MATKKKSSIDFAEIQANLASQFQGLNPNDPSMWPALPRYSLCVLLTVAVVVALWDICQPHAEALALAGRAALLLRGSKPRSFLDGLRRDAQAVQAGLKMNDPNTEGTHHV